MDLTVFAFAMLMGCAVGWSIGANDAANSLGTAVGARVLSLRQGIILISIFGLLGAMVEGEAVSRTIGKGIVNLSALPPLTAEWVALVAIFAACLWVVIATYLKMPISTSHSIVGAVAGAGLAIAAPVHWKVMRDIFLCWVLTPVGAAVISVVLYQILRVVFPRVVPERWSAKVLKLLIIVSGCYVAFSWGANDVANATGLLPETGMISARASIALGGLSIVLGVMTWGYKVIETIGSQITNLLPLMAFAAQLASAINVHVYTILGIPVSTSHSIVGAIVGVGLVRGTKVVNMRIMREIVTCWVATPFVSGILAFVLLKVLQRYVILN
jgi:PiT family inorganic phosphate transporter